MAKKTQLFGVLLIKNLSFMLSTACLLSLTAKKGLLCQAISPGKEIQKHSNNGTGDGCQKLYYSSCSHGASYTLLFRS